MRLNEVLFTPRPGSYFNRYPSTLKKSLAQKVLRVALEIIGVLCGTYFFFGSLKFHPQRVACVSCSLILLHMIVNRFFKWSFERSLIENKAKKVKDDCSFCDSFEVNRHPGSDSPFITGSKSTFVKQETLLDEEEFNLPPRSLSNEFDRAANTTLK